jgi:alkylation response protein AidB-like acyl-CoA dehydrogenase
LCAVKIQGGVVDEGTVAAVVDCGSVAVVDGIREVPLTAQPGFPRQAVEHLSTGAIAGEALLFGRNSGSRLRAAWPGTLRHRREKGRQEMADSTTSPIAPLPWPAILEDDQRTFYSRARRITAEVLAPLAESNPPGRVNRPLLRALASEDLLPYLFPERYGGRQPERVRATDLCLLRDAIATESTEAETALAMQGLGSYPILEAGSPELVKRWIPEVAAGRAVAGFALSEAAAGSDVVAMEAVAERDGDGYRLSGEKLWISNAPEADVYTVFARTAPGEGSRGITAFAVPGDSPGLGGEWLELLAPHPIGSLTLDGVFVPDGNVLGEPGHGMRVALETLSRFRPSVGAFAVGMAQAAFELANRHVDERQAFGGNLRKLQVVSHKLADMATRLHSARLAVYDAAAAFDHGDDRLSFRSSAAKALATEAAQSVVDDAVQIHGARALVVGHPLELLYREVRAPRIYEGATDVQFEIIARGLSG